MPTVTDGVLSGLGILVLDFLAWRYRRLNFCGLVLGPDWRA